MLAKLKSIALEVEGLPFNQWTPWLQAIVQLLADVLGFLLAWGISLIILNWQGIEGFVFPGYSFDANQLAQLIALLGILVAGALQWAMSKWSNVWLFGSSWFLFYAIISVRFPDIALCYNSSTLLPHSGTLVLFSLIATSLIFGPLLMLYHFWVILVAGFSYLRGQSVVSVQ